MQIETETQMHLDSSKLSRSKQEHHESYTAKQSPMI